MKEQVLLKISGVMYADGIPCFPSLKLERLEPEHVYMPEGEIATAA